MQYSEVLAFVDEPGNTNLDLSKNGVSSHFIVAAVIISKNDELHIKKKVNNIAQKYCDGKEMKSTNFIKKNKIKIWNELMYLDIYIVALVVDKQELVTEGYKHKKAFFKNLHGKVESHLLGTYPDIQIVADRHGYDDFMESFKAYIARKNKSQEKPELFLRQTFEFQDSKNEVMIQVADIIAGMLAQAYEKNKSDEDIAKLVFDEKKLHIISFPTIPRMESIDKFISEKDDSFSIMISQLSVHRACKFIDKNENLNDESKKDQVRCIEYLLRQFQYVNENDYISSEKLLEYINIGRVEKISKSKLRRAIIPKLRDSGVLIASHAQKPYGYKLPSSIEDIEHFLNHFTSVALPMMERIGTVRESIADVSRGAYDILDNEAYLKAKHLIDALKEFHTNEIKPEVLRESASSHGQEKAKKLK